MKPTILIADDEKNTREGLKWSLESGDYTILLAASGREAYEAFQRQPVDLVITDLKMPDMDGLELLKAIKADDPQVAVIMLTAHGTIENAVEAMNLGAMHYQTKPVDLKELKIKVQQALEGRRLAIENEQLKSRLSERYAFHNIIGRSPAMEHVFQIVRQVAPTRATVLIQGDSGTGKELIANAVHMNSPRARRPFVAVNCGALAATLLESELFGYEKGAFTNALKTKPGRFEIADGGTIFLDEISETSPEFQIRLLRVLQEQTFERVGGVEPIKVDVRVIAATNRNLKALVGEGKFREDLFYRLNVVTIDLPPLRDRREDIPLLVESFKREFALANNRPELAVSPKAMQLLQDFDWPGNVRQLRNVIEGLVVMSSGREVAPRDLPPDIARAQPAKGAVQLRVGLSLADAERELIKATLAEQGGNRARTARVLGIGRKTLYRKMEEYGIA
ncbi:MAG: sigma-54 dependent transcriptional regulator [Candidatus Sumerlaeia bacterium]